jgi:hypothetical protein
MKIICSLFSLRILTVIALLISVKFNVYSQFQNNEKHVLSHPLNYNPNIRNGGFYKSALFGFQVPETLNVYAIRVQFKTIIIPNNRERQAGSSTATLIQLCPATDNLYFI